MADCSCHRAVVDGVVGCVSCHKNNLARFFGGGFFSFFVGNKNATSGVTADYWGVE